APRSIPHLSLHDALPIWRQVHEHRIDAVDLHRAVHERTHAVVVADRNGELKFRHRPRSFCKSDAASGKVSPREGVAFAHCPAAWAMRATHGHHPSFPTSASSKLQHLLPSLSFHVA